MTEPSTTDYVPIACSLHSEYELAILHRRPLHLVWGENNFAGSEIGRPQAARRARAKEGARHNVIHDEVVLPLDLTTEHHEEFLLCRGKDGSIHRIRLDHVRRMKVAA